MQYSGIFLIFEAPKNHFLMRRSVFQHGERLVAMGCDYRMVEYFFVTADIFDDDFVILPGYAGNRRG